MNQLIISVKGVSEGVAIMLLNDLGTSIDKMKANNVLSDNDTIKIAFSFIENN